MALKNTCKDVQKDKALGAKVQKDNKAQQDEKAEQKNQFAMSVLPVRCKSAISHKTPKTDPTNCSSAIWKPLAT